MEKKIFLALVFAFFANISYSQNFTIENVVGRGNYFKGYITKTSTEETRWTVKMLNVAENGDSYNVSYQVYHVDESPYEEIPNDTTQHTFSGEFKKLTNKDGSGYTLKHSEYDGQLNYSIIISKSKYFDDYTIMIHYQLISSDLVSRGYCVSFRLTAEEFERLQVSK